MEIILNHITGVKKIQQSSDFSYHDYFIFLSHISNSLKSYLRASLAVWWLRLWAPNAGGMGLIPSQETKIPHASQCGKKKKKLFGGAPAVLCPKHIRAGLLDNTALIRGTRQLFHQVYVNPGLGDGLRLLRAKWQHKAWWRWELVRSATL